MQLPPNGETLGELYFTHYYLRLGEMTGMPFSEMRWNALTDWERHSCVEAICLVIDVAMKLGVCLPNFIDPPPSPCPPITPLAHDLPMREP